VRFPTESICRVTVEDAPVIASCGRKIAAGVADSYVAQARKFDLNQGSAAEAPNYVERRRQWLLTVCCFSGYACDALNGTI
jgi:hypothetical protein